MRFIFKTRYEQDLLFFKDRHTAFWYGLLMLSLLLAPWFVSEYFQTQLIFIFISGLVGLGLMLLAGFTGQMSMGHAAFLAIGAYAEAYLQARGWPFLFSAPIAMLMSAVAGVAIALPALRLTGLYLAIATLAFGFIVEEGLARWESVTGGNAGMMVAPLKLIVGSLESDQGFYYLCLGLIVVVATALKNLLRAPTGRALIAIRDSEVSAQSMGVNLARYKTLSFALSAAITGLAGALYAHQIKFLSPEQFTVLVSIEFLMMVVIGGLGSLHGAIFGAMFIILLPEAISTLKDWLPESLSGQTGLKATLFGLIMILFVIFEPLGLYGTWVKIRTYFSLFPLYKRGMFKRQRSYTKSERVH
ncbi:MAG: branched-chain amino acid ABC transporter permease [Betaproteobacteria bacterium]|nr:branched-chain amino acid ABC transporter permease [Betaproteobacteria bacterium]NBP34032.1 branched-chain amino acid ABC transporter permease [Betaproteobacteria bacterium]NBP36875.1 branched-chain amino acid ABC transporter permease [Betaproteobacteria bacterium]NBQ77154.1 branched-chain amino acid ABC transporter permease [Betaproteobacteria bacterium]NBQ95589.1 branched-chain amino acid ABC transporter permease [Betaproteobacteria bacterium]